MQDNIFHTRCNETQALALARKAALSVSHLCQLPSEVLMFLKNGGSEQDRKAAEEALGNMGWPQKPRSAHEAYGAAMKAVGETTRTIDPCPGTIPNSPHRTAELALFYAANAIAALEHDLFIEKNIEWLRRKTTS